MGRDTQCRKRNRHRHIPVSWALRWKGGEGGRHRNGVDGVIREDECDGWVMCIGGGWTRQVVEMSGVARSLEGAGRGFHILSQLSGIDLIPESLPMLGFSLFHSHSLSQSHRSTLDLILSFSLFLSLSLSLFHYFTPSFIYNPHRNRRRRCGWKGGGDPSREDYLYEYPIEVD